MRTYKLYTATVTGNAICNVTIQRSGRIKSVRWSVLINDTADNHTYSMEISTLATSQIAAHDTQNSIDQLSWLNNVGAAGVDHGAMNHQVLLDYPVAAGERLYLNGSSDVGAALTTVFVDIDD